MNTIILVFSQAGISFLSLSFSPFLPSVIWSHRFLRLGHESNWKKKENTNFTLCVRILKHIPGIIAQIGLGILALAFFPRKLSYVPLSLKMEFHLNIHGKMNKL